MEFVAGQARQFEERRARIEQQVQALARQQLAALVELALGLGGFLQHGLFELAQLFDTGQHRRVVAREVSAVGIKVRFEDWHEDSSCSNGLAQNRPL